MTDKVNETELRLRLTQSLKRLERTGSRSLDDLNTIAFLEQNIKDLSVKAYHYRYEHRGARDAKVQVNPLTHVQRACGRLGISIIKFQSFPRFGTTVFRLSGELTDLPPYIY